MIGDVLQILPSGLAGFAPPAAPAGQPVFFTMSGTALAGGVALNLDVDLTAYLDSIVLIEARVLAATKTGTAHMTDGASAFADGVFDNKNSVVSLGTVSAGGYANPMQSTPQMITIHPSTCDPNLRSGGFAPWTATWLAPGGAIARLTIVNSNALNNGPCTVFFTLYKFAAP